LFLKRFPFYFFDQSQVWSEKVGASQVAPESWWKSSSLRKMREVKFPQKNEGSQVPSEK